MRRNGWYTAALAVSKGGSISTSAAGGGDRAKSEDQPHAKIAHAPQPTVWSTDEEREAMPIAGDAERPLPDARWNVAGSTKGQ